MNPKQLIELRFGPSPFRMAAMLLLVAFACSGCVTSGTVGSPGWYKEQRESLKVDYDNGLVNDEEYVLRLRRIVSEQEAYEARQDAIAQRANQNKKRHRIRSRFRYWRYY